MLVYIKVTVSVNCSLMKLSDNTEEIVASYKSSHLCLQMVWPKNRPKKLPSARRIY